MMRAALPLLQRRLVLFIAVILFWSCLHAAVAQNENNNSSSSSSEIGALFHLLATLPFTAINEGGGESESESMDLGFSHAAAVLMALDDFYARQSNIVTSLEGIILTLNHQNNNNNCSIPTTKGAWHVTIEDSQSSGSASSEAVVVQHHHSNNNKATTTTPPPPPPLTAVVGGYYYGEVPSMELAAIGTALHIPTTVYGGSNLRVASGRESAFASRTFPDVLAFGDILLDYLQRPVSQGGLERTDFYSLLVPAVSEVARQNEQVLVQAMDQRNILFSSISYASDDYIPGRSLDRAMEDLKATGFRTILLLLDNWKVELPMIAKAAVEAGLTNGGEYVWVLVGTLDMAYFDDPSGNLDENVIQLVRGAAIIQPIDPFRCKTSDDPFLLEWERLDANFLKRVNAMLPDASFHKTNADYFQTTSPSPGSAFCYDAVMATLLASCSSEVSVSPNDVSIIAEEGTATMNIGTATTSDGTNFVNRLRDQVFPGASGPVRFGNSQDYPGGRTGESVTFGFLNIANPGLRLVVDDNDPGNDRGGAKSSTLVATNYGTKTPGQARAAWEYKNRPFVYADGTQTPPALLRNEPEMNTLSRSVRILGFFLFSLSMLLILGSMLWIYFHHTTNVMRAAQPIFLYGLLIGSMLVALCIVTNSFDESYGWTAEQLSRACTATPWLLITGIQLLYLSLFCKLWRINKVLQFRRRQVTVQSVVLPAVAIFSAVLIVLAFWTGFYGFDWVRTELNEMTGESMGACSGIDTVEWFTPIFICMFVPVIMVAVMAWKTKDIEEKYSETKWIYYMITFQLQLVLMAIPFLFFVDGKHADARYVGQVVVFFIFSVTAVGFLMAPKYIAYYFPHETNDGKRRGAGGAGKVKVSGLANSSASKKRASMMSAAIHNKPVMHRITSYDFNSNSKSSYSQYTRNNDSRCSGTGISTATRSSTTIVTSEVDPVCRTENDDRLDQKVPTSSVSPTTASGADTSDEVRSLSDENQTEASSTPTEPQDDDNDNERREPHDNDDHADNKESQCVDNDERSQESQGNDDDGEKGPPRAQDSAV